ncbi:MAG: universal stress protein [Spirochaetaceae bacterium]|jgi:nucleotide-binding universal stress UspA family protein|nr:universal stress protein [Spirochaetaceae bacterium]
MIKPLFQNVLINVNSTEASIHAVQYGILMAKLYRCNLKAVYVVDTATLKQLTLNKFFVEEESNEYETNLLSDGAGYLKYVEELGKEKKVPIETEIRRGAIWSEVITAAEEKQAGLILLGGWERDLADQRDVLSTSYRKILLNARCSVLIVKEKQIEQLYKLA